MPKPRTLAQPRGMTLGQRYHTLKGLYMDKCHTKFQLSSPEGIKVKSCKRNADVNLHLNLNLVTNVTYAHMHVRTRHIGKTLGPNIMAKRYMPHSCQGRWGHRNYSWHIFLTVGKSEGNRTLFVGLSQQVKHFFFNRFTFRSTYTLYEQVQRFGSTKS